MRRGAGVICLSGSKLLGNEPAIYLSDALLAIYKINGLVCALSLNKYRLVTISNLHFSSALVISSSPLLGIQLLRYSYIVVSNELRIRSKIYFALAI